MTKGVGSQWTALAVGAVILGLAIELGWNRDFWANQAGLRRQQNRGELLAVYRRLKLGMSADEIAPMLSRLAQQQFRLYVDCRASGVCSAFAPSEFGARHWVLSLRFDQGALSAARVRTADSVLEHPVQAPPGMGEWRDQKE